MNTKPEIIMYSRATCSFCVAARNVLSSHGAEWTEVSLDTEPDRRGEMIERSGHNTVPQIFIGDFHVGGFDDLQALDEEGALERILEQGTP